MPRGGARAGAGRPRKPDAPKPAPKKATAVEAAPPIPKDIADAADAEQLTPLEFMLRVMNNPDAPGELRARMAQAAAPYVHAKPGDKPKGKKEEAQERAHQVASKYAARKPPAHSVQ